MAKFSRIPFTLSSGRRNNAAGAHALTRTCLGAGCLPAAEDAHPPTAAPPRRRPRLATRHGARLLLRKTLPRNLGRRKPSSRGEGGIVLSPAKRTSPTQHTGTERAAAPGCPAAVGWLSKGQGKRGGSRMVTAHPSWQGGVTPSDLSWRWHAALRGSGSWLYSARLQEPSAALLEDLCALWHQQKTQPGGSTPRQSCPLPKMGSLRPGSGFRGIPQVIPADG